MAISAGDAERSERQRHWVLSLANDQGFEYVTEVLNSMIEYSVSGKNKANRGVTFKG